MVYYAVISGLNPGVYATYPEALEQRCKGIKFSVRKCIDKEAAERRMESNDETHTDETDFHGQHAIYTDGAAKNNQGDNPVAGYGVFYGDGDARNEGLPLPKTAGVKSTNNRAEGYALIRALEGIIEHRMIDTYVYSDSAYFVNAINQWIPGWKRRGWKKADGTPCMNIDYMKRIDTLLQQINMARLHVRVRHVKGHAGIHGNEEADRLANQGCV